MIAAELMTNAIRHTASGADGGTFTVTVRQQPGLARIEVRDMGNGAQQWCAGGPAGPHQCAIVPLAQQAGDDLSAGIAEQGRGLMMVSTLADSCGHEVTAAQTQTCWAVLTW